MPFARGNAMRIPPIFFHPDYDRRPWPLTRSADPARECGRSRARGNPAFRQWPHTAGGDFHPAL